MALAQHLSLSNEHYTPPEICDRVRAVLNGIELDPCSNDLANTLVQADRFWTQADDGFSRRWEARTLWLNPPGGRQFRNGVCFSTQSLWLNKLRHHYQCGDVGSGMFLSFNLEILRHCQWILSTTFAVFNERPRYWSWDDESGALRSGQWALRKGQRVWTDNPGHAGMVICLSDDMDVLSRFHQQFGDGTIARCSVINPLERGAKP